MKTIEVIKPVKAFDIKRTRVAAYARVSVEGELKEHSLAAQVDHYTKLIHSNPRWKNVGIFADYGITGTKTARPGFQNLIKLCDKGKVDLVLTKSISRFARNTVDLLNTVRHLKDIGVNVHFENEHIDSISSDGELMMTLLGSIAQEYARSMSENCKWAIHKRFEQGIGNWYNLFGYKYVSDHFEVVPEEAEIIMFIFDSYLSGLSTYQIVKALDDKGCRTRDNYSFQYTRIFKILRQEKYTGNSLLQKTYKENYLTKKKKTNYGELPKFYATETHPAIITQETFDLVQSEIIARQALGYMANQKTHFSCLTGKIVCAYCGHTFRRRMKSEGNYKAYIWKCGTKIEKGQSACCGQNIPEKLLLTFIAEVLNKEIATPEDINSSIDKIIVSVPCTALITLKNGETYTKKWTYEEKTRLHKEVF